MNPNPDDRLWLDQVWQQLAAQIEVGSQHEFIHGAIVGRRFDPAAAHRMFARLSGEDGLSAFRLLCAALCELQLRQGQRLDAPSAPRRARTSACDADSRLDPLISRFHDPFSENSDDRA